MQIQQTKPQKIQKGSKRYPREPKRGPNATKRSQKEPKGGQREPHEVQREPKRAQMGAKMDPKGGKKGTPKSINFDDSMERNACFQSTQKHTSVQKKIRILQHLEAPKRVPREPPVIPKDPLGSQMGSQRVLRGVPTWPNLNRGLKITRCVK